MGKAKKKMLLPLILNAAAALFAALVIVSLALAFFGEGRYAVTGFDMFESSDAGVQTLTVMSMIFAIIILVLGVLRVIGLFKGKLFGLIFAIAGLGIIAIGISAIIVIPDMGLIGKAEPGVGLILNLVFSLFAGLSSIAVFAIKKK